MLQKTTLFLSFLLISTIGFSQKLYQPRDVKVAYANQTRSLDGKPGPKYWQNRAVYNINIKAAPPSRTVSGSEDITYTNNSPDALTSLNFKLFLNGHKPGAARQGQVGKDYMTSGMHIDSYVENGVKKPWDSKNDSTNKRIKLTKALQPGETIKLHFDWHFDVSVQSGREGMLNPNTFFLAYFYPRVAVYDDYKGWDTMPFVGHEFYNDFNDYTLSVTVPKNYIVWATGDLQNTDEVLQPKYAKMLKKSMKSDEIFTIATPADLKKAKITKQNVWNTWVFTTKNITDVALSFSNNYNWDAGSVVVDAKTNRRASVQAAYDDTSKDFHSMVEFGKHALGWFSNNYPGVPYPFSKSTIVRGVADMEYPMMVNDNTTPNLEFSRFVAEHEIAHSYFPFYMGINETRFAFMDEGWATALEHLVGIADLGQEKADQLFKNFRVNRWIHDANMEEDLPIITPANIVSGVAYRNNAYGKPALGYLAVKDLLGDALFTKTLQGYMKRWNGKHPTPWDFFYSFNDVSGKNLNWFWNSWYFSNHYIDIAIKSVNTKTNGATITLENIGGMPAPFDVIVTTTTGAKKVFHQTAEVWKVHNDATVIILNDVSDIASINIEGGIFMDADTTNNTWKK